MLPEHLARKYWGHVETALRDLESRISYYIGGTLSISLTKERGIALNLDGTGFVFNQSRPPRDERVHQPDFILKIVRELYRKTYGKTDFYKESVKKRKL